ncbi:MAG: hypothetical protein WCK42_04740 [Myxococcaceae bacterium]
MFFFCSWVSFSSAFSGDMVRPIAFAASASTAVVVCVLDAVSAYYSYDVKNFRVGTAFHGAAAVLLGGASVMAFTGKNGPNIAVVLSGISWFFALGGSVANFVAQDPKFGISIAVMVANLLPIAGYFFTRSMIDPGVRQFPGREPI